MGGLEINMHMECLLIEMTIYTLLGYTTSQRKYHLLELGKFLLEVLMLMHF